MYKRRKTQRNAEPKKVERREDSDEHEMEDEEDDQIAEDQEIHCTFNNPGKFALENPFKKKDNPTNWPSLTPHLFVFVSLPNTGWADVISKILSKQPKLQPNQESCIMSKATKDYETIETETTRRTDKERREWENLNRLKPNAGDPTVKERERKLTAIANRGVVQLFNTIAEQKEERRKKWGDSLFERQFGGWSDLSVRRSKEPKPTL